ncbi:nuclear transport factor 2 family protein [Streptomyces sp. NBC_01275]|uniref:nuclear transport factor 2 family protein n=1 Tax=Streptomyces sp. NBC_01275 TaxID=2903807 RepID=UPI0022506B62|nr:nuclear transport factor 2 family protein [Streptomyces sp. NBC_01275]MCX4761613.1 nuclear transport factor 2 family protein [Streptomyces sp. NBC_01275]
MDPIEQLLAERACQRLLLGLVRRLDLGEQPASVAELFTEDGTWAWPERDRLVTGRDALRAHFGSRAADRRARRLMSDVHVEVTSPDTATATSYFTTFHVDHDRPTPGPPVGIGHYEDVLHRTPDGSWLLARRTLHLSSSSPAPLL